MKTKWVNLIVIVLAVATLAVIVAAFVVKDDNTKNPSQDSAITVPNDKSSAFGKDLPITVEYQYFLQFTKNNMLKQNNVDTSDATAVQKFWEKTNNGKPLLDTVKEYALNSVKEYRVLMMKVKEKKLSIDSSTLANMDAQLNNEIQSYGSSAESTVKSLYGVSVSDYSYITKNLYLAYVLLKQDTEKGIKVDKAEAQAYFDKNKKTVEQATVRHILISTVDQTTGKALSKSDQAKAKKTAEDILKRIKNGEDMATLVSQYSQDTGSVSNGGVYTFKRGQMVKPFEDWAFKAKVGDLGIVKSQFGYHVMRLEGRTTPEQAYTDKKYADIVAGWKKADESKVDVSDIK